MISLSFKSENLVQNIDEEISKDLILFYLDSSQKYTTLKMEQYSKL
jgi:hypothetical protein